MAAKQNCGRVCKTFRLIKSVVTIPEIRNLYVTLYKFSTRQRTVNLSFFIARRMAQPAPGNKPGVMERIAVVSVALGMAVMILAMAVIMGFKREVARKMTGFAAHVAVTDIRGVNALDAQPVRRSAHVEELIRRTDGFVAMAPYAVKGGIVRTADDAPLFAVRGKTAFVSPAEACVERELGLRAVEAAGLELEERPVMRDELPRFDELFYVDHRGVTALAHCDGHPCMAILAERVAQSLGGLFPKM